MEKRELDREVQIWQRVADCRLPESGDIRPLLLAAVESAAAYRQLTQLLTGKQRERVKMLLTMARRTLEGLRGIQRMSGHPAENLRPLPMQKESARRLLERCYHGALRQMTEYTARTMDPVYGTVFQRLADREREAALILAELLGGLEK